MMTGASARDSSVELLLVYLFHKTLRLRAKTNNNGVCSLLRPRIQRSRKVVLGLAHPG
jgi:hypothetical protein